MKVAELVFPDVPAISHIEETARHLTENSLIVVCFMPTTVIIAGA